MNYKCADTRCGGKTDVENTLCPRCEDVEDGKKMFDALRREVTREKDRARQQYERHHPKDSK